MTHLIEEIPLKTGRRSELVDITGKVQGVVSKSGVKEGTCVVYCPHTTVGITINENADPSVKADILDALEKLVPANAGYAHAEGNSDSHIKASLMGNSRTIIVTQGKLALGTWESLYFAEFDGPRQRKLLVKIIEG